MNNNWNWYSADAVSGVEWLSEVSVLAVFKATDKIVCYDAVTKRYDAYILWPHKSQYWWEKLCAATTWDYSNKKKINNREKMNEQNWHLIDINRRFAYLCGTSIFIVRFH